MRDAADATISSRRARDEDLRAVSRQLQRMDEERRSALAGMLRVASSYSCEAADTVAASVGRVSAAVDAIDVASDVRMFVHQRRVAIMLDEYGSRHPPPVTSFSSSSSGGGGATTMQSNAPSSSSAAAVPGSASVGAARHSRSSGSASAGGSGSSFDLAALAGTVSGWASAATSSSSSDTDGGAPTSAASSSSSSSSTGRDPDDISRLIPSPHAVATILRHHRDYIAAEKELAPLMYRWVGALLRNEGGECLHGMPVAATAAAAEAAAARAAAEAASASATASAASTEASAPATSSPEIEGGPTLTSTTAPAAPATSPTSTTAAAAPTQLFEVSLLDEQAARYAFLRALSARRAQLQNVGAAFPRFARIFWWCLDACQAAEDARGAQMVLILSETFFRWEQSPSAAEGGGQQTTGAGGDAATAGAAAASGAATAAARKSSGATATAPKKQFVQSCIARHAIWRRFFWEESFYRGVRDEVAKLIDPASASNSRLVTLFAAEDAADLEAEEDAAAAAAATAAASAPVVASSAAAAMSSMYADANGEEGAEVEGSSGAAASAASSFSSSSSSSSSATPRRSPSPDATSHTTTSTTSGSVGKRASAAAARSSESAAAAAAASQSFTVEQLHYTYEQIVFGQLMALGLNMTSFGVERGEVTALLALLAAGSGLPAAMAEGLKGMVEAQRGR